ncbi:MAG: CrcB protein [Oleiphilaceae bacterium]|jgi:CrcB protein
MKHLLLIAIAGAVGAMARYTLVNFVGGRNFPWGTMTVNILGSFLMGVAYIVIVEKAFISPEMKPFFMTGFLGAFTTFSAFSLEAWQLLDRGETIQALTYVAGSVIFCLMAVMVGVFMTRLTLN